MMKPIQSERALLGALLLNASLFVQVKDIICGADFASNDHAIIFKTMREVFNERGTFDAAIISDKEIIDFNFLNELKNDCCSTANLLAHADIIREQSVRRQLKSIFKKINIKNKN